MSLPARPRLPETDGNPIEPAVREYIVAMETYATALEARAWAVATELWYEADNRREAEFAHLAEELTLWMPAPAGTIPADTQPTEATMEIERGQVPEAQAGGTAEGEDAGVVPGAPEELREEDVTRADGLDDRVAEEDLPGDD